MRVPSESAPTLSFLSLPSRAYVLVLLAVALATTACLLSLADERARWEAYIHNPILWDLAHCGEHHGTVVQSPKGYRYCRILVV